MEQYANEKEPGREVRGQAPPLEAETLLAFWTFNGSCKFACFLIFGDTENHRYPQSARSRIIYSDFSKTIFVPDLSPTTQIPRIFPVFPDINL